MNILPLAQATPQPWRNGGGISYPLLFWPSEAEWRVRVSVAYIEQDGPFSSYHNVHRWFCVLDGDGVALHLAVGTCRLRPGDRPLQFDGAEAPGCTLLGGPTRDLNLMLRGTASSGLVRVQAAEWVSPQPHRAVFTTTATTLHTPAGAHALPAMTLAWVAEAAGAPWRLDPVPTLAWWFDWTPA